MPGEPFNETDVISQDAPMTGSKLLWTNGRRWIALLATGGIVETLGVHTYEVSHDGARATELTPDGGMPGTCRAALDEAKRP